MRAKNFSKQALEHLSRYKEEVLGVCEVGKFTHRGEELHKRHILPKAKQHLNLLPLVRGCFTTLKDTGGRPLKWHRYFHHLNSSQALAVNLFQPFLTTPARQSLLASLLDLNQPLRHAGFEHVADPREGTNVDFFAEGADGASVFVEVKFTEREFGAAKDDERHRAKYAEVYEHRVAELAVFGEDAREEFFAAYQFFRNALHARQAPAQRVWFLVPRRNLGVALAAEKNIRQLKPDTAKNVQIVYLEDFFELVENEVSDDPELALHFREFRRKYFIPLEDG
jgi:hypothetical protein